MHYRMRRRIHFHPSLELSKEGVPEILPPSFYRDDLLSLECRGKVLCRGILKDEWVVKLTFQCLCAGGSYSFYIDDCLVFETLFEDCSCPFDFCNFGHIGRVVDTVWRKSFIEQENSRYQVEGDCLQRIIYSENYLELQSH